MEHEKELKILHELYDIYMEKADECKNKLRRAGEVSNADLEIGEALSHTLKSFKTLIAMIEAGDEEGGYSGRYMPRYYPGGMSWASDGRGNRGGNSYDGGSSYARGQRRDSMGRYSREGGYSYAAEIDGIMDDLRGLMADMPAEKQRTVERLMTELQR